MSKERESRYSFVLWFWVIEIHKTCMSFKIGSANLLWSSVLQNTLLPVLFCRTTMIVDTKLCKKKIYNNELIGNDDPCVSSYVFVIKWARRNYLAVIIMIEFGQQSILKLCPVYQLLSILHDEQICGISALLSSSCCFCRTRIIWWVNVLLIIMLRLSFT